MEVKKIIKTKVFLEAVIVITVVLALVLPSSAVVTNKDVNEEKDFFWHFPDCEQEEFFYYY